MTSQLARDIADLPDPAFQTFWHRLLHEYLHDPPPTDQDITALQDFLEHSAQDQPRFTTWPKRK